MNITVICSDASHAVVPHLREWVRATRAAGHSVQLAFDVSELSGGDLLFLVSCSQIVRKDVRAKFGAALVLHASRLPDGRGWSPHIWTIVNGGNEITVTLLEAADKVDTGAIWLQESFTLEGHELLPDINARLFASEISLMSRAVAEFGQLSPTPQSGEAGVYLRKRTPQDSELDPNKSLAEQFNLLRVVDSERYPAFFRLHGHRYLLKIEKAPTDD
jgi:methionyl-tRNA formyltransferase